MLVRSAGLLVCRSAGLLAAGCWSGLFTLGDHRGHLQTYLRLPFFMFFGGLFSNPLKSTFGANLAPTCCQNESFEAILGAFWRLLVDLVK